MALIPASKHLHLVLSPITVFLKSPELGNLPNLDFEKEQVGLETVKDLGSKSVLDAFTCVECGRCQVNCPAWGAGKELNPKTIILQTQEALLAGERETKLGEVYSREGAVAVHDVRRLREPVPGRHRASADSDRVAPRPGLERRRARVSGRRCTTTSSGAATSGGSATISARSSSTSAALETFDPAKHDVLVWLGCAGVVRGGLPEVAAVDVRDPAHAAACKFGVLSKEKLHRRSGQAHRQRVHVSGAGERQHRGSEGGRPEEDPDVVSALREDDRRRLPEVRLRRSRSSTRRSSSRS